MAATFTAQSFRNKVSELFTDIHTFYSQAGVSPLDEEHITIQLSLKLSEWARTIAGVTVAPWFTVTGENMATWKTTATAIAGDWAFHTIFASKGVEDELGFDVAWDVKFGAGQRFTYYLQAKVYKGTTDGVDFTYPPTSPDKQYNALNTLINTRPRGDALNVGGGYLIYADVRNGAKISYAPISEINAIKAAMPNVAINKALGLYFLRDQYLFTNGAPHILVNPTPVLAVNPAVIADINGIEANSVAALAALPNAPAPAAIVGVLGDFNGAWLRGTITTLYGNINQLYTNAQAGNVVVFEEHITTQLNLELSRAVKIRLNQPTLVTWSNPGAKGDGYDEEAKPVKPITAPAGSTAADAQAAQAEKLASTLRRSKAITRDELDDNVKFRAYLPSKGLESLLGHDFAWHVKFFDINGIRTSSYTYYLQAKKVGDRRSINFSYDGNKQLAAISNNTAFTIAKNTGPAGLTIDAAYIVYSGARLLYVPARSAVDGGTLLEEQSKLSTTTAVDEALGVWFDSTPDALQPRPFEAPFPPLNRDPALIAAAIATCGGAPIPGSTRPRRSSSVSGPRRIWKDIQDTCEIVLAPARVAKSATAAAQSATSAAADSAAAATAATGAKGKVPAPLVDIATKAAAAAAVAAQDAANANTDAQATIARAAAAKTAADVAAATRAVTDAADAAQRAVTAATAAASQKDTATTAASGKRPAGM